MINLVDAAWADGKLYINEGKAIGLAQQELSISAEQLAAIKRFTQEMRKMRTHGLSSHRIFAEKAAKKAVSGLAAVGVPIAAIGFSGSVAGFSAAGITSGLAGLGAWVGLGSMIPGVGVAIASGGMFFIGSNWLLNRTNRAKQAKFEAEKQRRTQALIENVKAFANQLTQKIENLSTKEVVSQVEREKVQILSQRLGIVLSLLKSLD